MDENVSGDLAGDGVGYAVIATWFHINASVILVLVFILLCDLYLTKNAK